MSWRIAQGALTAFSAPKFEFTVSSTRVKEFVTLVTNSFEGNSSRPRLELEYYTVSRFT